MSSFSTRVPALLLVLALLGGAVLRLAWLSEMEWKDDETWTFEHSQQIGSGTAWSWSGMPASVKIPNPGMSVWVFSLPAIWLHDPVSMTAWVAAMNIAALIAFMMIIRGRIGPSDRTTWLLGTVLLCVNPVAVLASRKLWAQDVLTPCMPLLIPAFLSRRSRWGAFVWGLTGTLMGQIHLSGFFFQAGLVLWAFVEARVRKRVAPGDDPESTPEAGPPRWFAFACGTALAILPMIPWAYELLHGQAQAGAIAHESRLPPDRLGAIRHLLGFLVLNPLGLAPTLVYFRTDLWSFLREPLILGRASYLVLIAHVAITGLFGLGLLNLLRRGLLATRGGPPLRARLASLWPSRPDDRWLPSVSLALYTLLLLLIVPHAYYHYLIIVSWFLSIVLVQVLRASFPSRGPAVVLAFAALQCFLSLSLLWFVHQHRTTPTEYGVPYRYQAVETIPGPIAE